METQEKVRKIRSKPMRWERFFRLSQCQIFYLGTTAYMKRSWKVIQHSLDGKKTAVVLPWRRVKTAQPVKRPDGKVPESAGPWAGIIEKVKLRDNPGKTHFVGDDCPGGHHELVKQLGGLQAEVNSLPAHKRAPFQKELEEVAKELGVDNRENSRTVGSMEIRHGDEPNNANNITGPTC